jgi:zinc-ribbon domain
MSEPEIARRCSACGLSVRERAMFCPQCGNPVSQSTVAVSDTMTENAPTAPTQALDSAPRPAAHRVREDGVRGRVEKLRKVSSVMIDQAAYDPSLRFLLVAAGFFLLFLVLLILSKVLG